MTAFARITFDPGVPWWLLTIVAIVAVLLLGLAFWRRSGGAVWRLLAITAALLALANPSLVQEQRTPIPDVALVVVDQSISQRIGKRMVRTEAALERIEQKLAGRRDLELRVIRAGSTPDGDRDGGASLLPDGTHLFGAIRRALRDVPRRRLAGIIIIGDGQIHDIPKTDGGDDLGGPVHLLLSGERGERDRRLVVVKAPSYGIVGEELNLSLRVEDSRIRDDSGVSSGGDRKKGGFTPPSSAACLLGRPAASPSASVMAEPRCWSWKSAPAPMN